MSVSNIISMLNLTEMPPDKKVNRKLIFLFLNLNLYIRIMLSVLKTGSVRCFF